MTMQSDVDEFLAQRTLAVVGVSRSGRKFGNVVLRELSAKGYTVLPVHREAAELDGHQAYARFDELPAGVGGAVVVVPPPQTAQVVQEAAASGIRRFWLQQGATSDEALAFCKEHGLQVIHDECILMFAAPSGLPHRLHRFIWKLVGKLPH
jgi:uncharacterized protein